MPDFVSLERSIRRSTILAAGVCAGLLAVSIGSLAFAVHQAWQVRQAAARLPVLVVPGAIAGIYAPGRSEESIKGLARYLAGLATNFSGLTSMDQRFDELESFASAAYLPQLRLARQALRHDVETQGQARSFLGTPGHEELKQIEPGRFEYTVQGQRIVYASGLLLESREATLRLRLSPASPSRADPLGLSLESFEVADLPVTSHHAPGDRQPPR